MWGICWGNFCPNLLGGNSIKNDPLRLGFLFDGSKDNEFLFWVKLDGPLNIP